ncbi:ExeM/NucH family extracellular endonuclease [Pseudoalteromonas luteoviolacea]|nr:ExeM/NucH family extracellular endonuclease [Pseudoalteromonas luteoviolacea]KZN36377.1 hypothetical protein N483_22360 [Pseudoalteromonas luteoviolacea NCIMB 1944]
MIKTKLTPLAMLIAATTASAQAQVIISEYIEGSSNNKAIELYNTSDETISLSDYTLSYYSNGNTSASNNISLSGSIAAKGTFVIANSNAVALIKDKADLDVGGSWFNGDDAVVLHKGDAIVDSFGQLGTDPGSNWEGGGVITKDKTLRRKSEITTGRNTADAAFDPSEQWLQFDKDDFSGLGVHGQSSTDDGGEEPIEPPAEPLVCGDPITTINAIQGSGEISPLKDQVVTLEGVVTADLQADNQLKGFFVQSLSAHMDTDPSTSEGLFIYDANSDVNVGDTVRVKGTVQEFYNSTQLGNIEQVEICGSAEFKATQLTLPVSDLSDFEAIEGMLVTINQPLYVTDNYGLSRYGELGLASERLYQSTQVAEPGEAANAVEAANKLKAITLDDGSTTQNPETVPYPSTGFDAYNTLRLGDSTNSVTGVVAYSFSKYRIHPTTAPEFVNTNPRTDAPELSEEGDLRIASFNVLNYFNGDGQGGGFPTPRGADNEAELQRQQAKLVSAITALDADVLGLMEVENDGFGELSAIASLVNALNAADTSKQYAFVNFNTDQIGTDAITSAIIYRADKVAEAGVASFTTAEPFDYGNRPPIAQSFRAISTGEEFTFAVGHLRSKGSCSKAEGLDKDQNDGQGCWNATRTQAAALFTEWLNSKPTGNQDADILLVGDMNAYAKEDPISEFATQGLHNVIHHIDGNTHSYSYSYGARIGSLDHALASQSLLDKVTDATDWHISADEPIALDYNTEFKSEHHVAALYAEHMYRASDHDPVIVEFKTQAPIPPVNPVPEITTGQSFSVKEDTPINSVIGILDFIDRDAEETPVEKFIVSGSTAVRINANGQIVTTGELDYEFDNRLNLLVQAQDSAGNLSEQVEVIIHIENVDDTDEEQSGSFGWLSLLALPFAFRRRTHK